MEAAPQAALPDWVKQRIAEERAHIRRGVRALVDGAARGDWELFNQGVSVVECHATTDRGWRSAARGIAELPTIPPRFRRQFRDLWVSKGDSWRIGIKSDLVLIDLLRALLLPYKGSGRRLWRGDSAGNRQRRTHGMSWTS
jgi:hypothetical protein